MLPDPFLLFLIVPGNHSSSTFCLTWVWLFWMFYIKGITQIWPLWLTSFSYCSVFRFIQVVAMLVLHSFYNRIIFHCINMPHFVYPFISWQTLDCFHFCLLWIKLSWTFVLIFFFLLEYVFNILSKYLRVKLLGHIILLYLTFWSNAKLFVKAAVPFKSLLGSVRGLQFLYIINISFSSLNYGHTSGCDTPVLLPGKSHGQRSLVGCSPWGR